jgi:glycerone phosphate O-acyltransferase
MWEGYVKRVAFSVLSYAVKYILNQEHVLIPHPVASYHNDLIFSGADRAPEPNLVLRRVFPTLHWTFRAGIQPNGAFVKLRAGGTLQKRLSILAQPHIQLLINQLARDQNVTKEAIQERASQILIGIGDMLNHNQMRTLAIVVRKVFHTLYDRIHLNDDAHQRLFEAFRRPRCSVIIIPAHRTYVDFLVVSYLLILLGLPLPHICTGEDFLRLAGLAEMMRGSGAFFMRRSFKGDKLYGALFREYVRHLVRAGECVEFFIEGMRSRTGKTLTPKLGILKFITDAFFEKQDDIDDVLIVPIGLSYEKLLEENVYAEELMGVPKPKETVGNLLKSASILRSKYGSLNVVVGEVISLKNFSADPFQCPDGFERIPPGERQAIKPTDSISSIVGSGAGTYTPLRMLASLAWTIAWSIQHNIVVTPTALVAAVVQSMLDHAQLRDGIPIAHVASCVEWLRSAVLHRKGKMNPRFAICDGAQLTQYAVECLRPRIWISPLSHVFMNFDMIITTKMLLSIYSNQLIHVFADEAILVIVAFAYGSHQDPSSQDGVQSVERRAHGEETQERPHHGLVTIPVGLLKQHAAAAKFLLSNEFPNFKPSCPIAFSSWFNVALQNLHDDNKSVVRLPVTDSDDEEVYFVRNTFTLFTSQLLYPFVESTYVVLLAVSATMKSGRRKMDVDSLVKLAHEGALSLYRMKAVDFVQCSSKENLKNGIDHLNDCGLLIPESGPVVTYTVAGWEGRPQKEERGGTNAKDAAEQLGTKLLDVNALRWRPSTTEAVESAIHYLCGIIDGYLSRSKV